MAGLKSLFGVGYLAAIPTGANPTPAPFSVLQDVSVEFSRDQKPLYGSFQLPIELGAGKAKIDIKAANGRIDPVLFNQIYFGGTVAAGEKRNAVSEVGVVPTTPFQVTVANGATFAVDLGVVDVTSGKIMTRGATSTGANVYAVNTATGVYTFNTADAGHSVRITYTYTAASSGGTISGTNPLMGVAPIFALHLINSYTGTAGAGFSWINFPACQASKLGFPFKLDDFTLPAFDMQASDDGTGNPYNMSFTGPG